MKCNSLVLSFSSLYRNRWLPRLSCFFGTTGVVLLHFILILQWCAVRSGSRRVAYIVLCACIYSFINSFVRSFIHSFIHSFILSVCLTTNPQPLPKRVLNTVRSSASSFSFQYLLLSLRLSGSCLRLLPSLPVISVLPYVFPSITCSGRQFLLKSSLYVRHFDPCNYIA
jgi:hypothetical protein